MDSVHPSLENTGGRKGHKTPLYTGGNLYARGSLGWRFREVVSVAKETGQSKQQTGLAGSY